MESVGIVADKPKKKFSRKKLVILGAFVLVLLIAAVAAWFVLFRPITSDRVLIEKAVAAINADDNKGLSAAGDSIRGVYRYDTSPEYLTILVVDAIRRAQPTEARQYFDKLKALGGYTYVSYVPWKDRASVLASLEHDITFLEKTKNGPRIRANGGGG